MLYVILQNPSGAFSIFKDYGDYAWNSPALWPVGYAKSYGEAQAFTKANRDKGLLAIAEAP